MVTHLFKINKLNSIKSLLLIYLLFYITLIFGFLMNENSTGGAQLDYEWVKNLCGRIDNQGLKNFLFNEYPISTPQHFPFFYVISCRFRNLISSEYLYRLIYLHFALLIPFLFYKNIKIIYKNSNKILYYIPCLFFISPYFRSLSIWSANEIFALIFLLISLLSFNKYIYFSGKKYQIYLGLFFLVIASYIRPEYSIIILFYFYKIFYLQNKNRELLLFLALGIILTIPLILFFQNISFNFLGYKNSIYLNLFRNTFAFFSVLGFYTIPFIIFDKKIFKNYINFLKKNINQLILLTLISFLLIYFFKIYYNIGGGIFYKALTLINFKFLFPIFSIIGFYNIIFLINKKKINYLILIMLFLQTSINFTFFQKYLDLMWLIYFFIIFKFNNFNYLFFNNKLFKFLIFYYLFFYFIALFYYSNFLN